MNVRPILLSLALVTPTPLFAQSARVLGRDDATFARKLFERGYTDLSDKLVALIESGTVAPKDQADIKALHLAVRLDLAQKETDPYKRKDLLKQIITEKEDLVKGYSGSTASEDTANTLPDTYSLLGSALLACIGKEKDVNLIAQLQNEGQKVFGQAEEKLKARIAELVERKDDPTVEGTYISARFNLPKTYYFHSLLYPAGDFAKKKLNDDAITLFAEFGLDYSDRLLNYEACIFAGLCYKELGSKEDATQSFNEAIALREQYEKDAKGVYLVEPASADVISKAVLQKVNLLVDQGDSRGAIDCAKDYFATVSDAYEALNGLAILAALGKAQLTIDPKGCAETIDKLLEIDGNGPWGAVARELQAPLAQRGAGMSSGELLKIAYSFAQRGMGEKAQTFARQAIGVAKGEKDAANVAVDAWLLIGAVFVQRGWNIEAALAFDTCYERFPNSEKAPEAVYQALMQYVALASGEKKPLFKTRVEERRKTLTTKYPTHDRAAFAQLVEGDGLTSEGKYLEAVDSYSKVQASSPSYYDAQLKIGSCYYLQARALDKDGKKSEAAQYYTQAETILKKAIDDFDRLASGNLDLEKLQRYEKNGFNARRQLADLYLQTGKFNKVLPLLEGADTKYANDAENLSQVWGLRIRALKEQGKLEDAIKLLDALASKDPNSKAIASGAGLIARELDGQAAAAHDAKKSKEANELWKRAANYYGISGRALLKSDSIKPKDVEDIATRLYVLGLLFNGVPEGQDTFIGWDTKKVKDTKLWELSAELYQAGLKISPSTEAQLNLARISAFLARWKLASDAFGEYANSSGSIFDALNTKKLSPGVGAAAILAAIERGVCDLQVAIAEKDKNRFDLAEDTLNRLYTVLQVDTQLWWYSAYYLIDCRFERGNYREAASCCTASSVRSTSSAATRASRRLRRAEEGSREEEPR